MSTVGQPLTRPDAAAKVTGTASYVDDIKVEGCLHGKTVLSTHPHAAIKRIDTFAAAGVDGVTAVITAEDIPGTNEIGVVIEDQPLLCRDRVRYTGDPVALIIAETREAIIEAEEKLVIEYDPLPGVFDPESSRHPDAQKIHSGGNQITYLKVRKGDAAQAMSRAEYRVSGTFNTKRQEHMYIEPLGSLAIPEPGGGVTIYASVQCPYYVRKATARALGKPLEEIRVIQAVTGGAFGGKEEVPSEICALSAVGAFVTGSPVKIIYERRDDVTRSSKRHPITSTYEIGADRNGRIIALKAELIADAGAYATLTPIVMFRSTVHACGPYEILDVSVTTRAFYTNNPPGGAFRGFGQPQVTFAVESLMDELAEKAGMDPLEFRLLNALDKGRSTGTGQVLTESVGLMETMRKSREHSDWDHERAKQRTRSRFREGIGVASCFYGVGLGAKGKHLDSSGARVTVEEDGSVRVSIGMTEMGQGSETVMTQIASETLGCRPEAITVLPAETSVVPDSGPTVASRTTLLSGNAVFYACRKITEKMRPIAAELLQTEGRHVRTSNGNFATDDPHEVRVSFEDVAREALRRGVALIADGWYQPPDTSFDENGQGDAYYVYSFATQIAKVSVDTETGRVRILKLIAAHDVGKAINPNTTRGQIQGGVVIGAGLALYEDFKLADGVVETCDFATYIIPTSMDSFEIVPVIVEDPWPEGPYGAKGFAETPTIPTAAAIANAIKHATGVRVNSLPMTPEKVYRALRDDE